ncbi:ERVV2 protein, partial [Hydrobates tethys]|nr:ERVV2 protein [Oceanodroma tethys]
TGFHSFTRQVLPWLGVNELEKALVNFSVAIEILGNNTADAIMALQEEVLQLSKITRQNRMALDTLLASQGGICTIINTSCCMYVDESGRISADVW